jgi:hypothetical protein
LIGKGEIRECRLQSHGSTKRKFRRDADDAATLSAVTPLPANIGRKIGAVRGLFNLKFSPPRRQFDFLRLGALPDRDDREYGRLPFSIPVHGYGEAGDHIREDPSPCKDVFAHSSLG